MNAAAAGSSASPCSVIVTLLRRRPVPHREVRDTRIAELRGPGRRRAVVADHIATTSCLSPARNLHYRRRIGWAGFRRRALLDVFGSTMNPVIAAILAFVLVTFSLSFFGEFVPQSVAIAKPSSATLMVALPLR